MKRNILLLLPLLVLVFAFKDKGAKVNPTVFGNYYANDTAAKPTWILKQNFNDNNKIEFYQPGEIEPTFMVTMKDSTHFKTTHEFSHTSNQITKMWMAKGYFMPDGKMELVIHLSDMTSGLKFSFSFDEDEKIIYSKR